MIVGYVAGYISGKYDVMIHAINVLGNHWL